MNQRRPNNDASIVRILASGLCAITILVALPMCNRLHAATLYAMGLPVGDDSSNLYRIDDYATAPTAVDIGETGLLLTDLAIEPKTGRFFSQSVGNSSSAPGNLYEVDPADGSVSLIGSLGVFGINALDFDRSGRLFGWSFSDTVLYEISTSTGLATAVGETGFESAGDIVFDRDGSLFGSDLETRLISINPENGSSTVVGPFGIETGAGFDGMFGLEIDTDGTLFGARGILGQGLVELYTVDKNTGQASLIGVVSDAADLGVSGLAFVPEPSTLLLALVTLGVIGGCRMRNRAA